MVAAPTIESARSAPCVHRTCFGILFCVEFGCLWARPNSSFYFASLCSGYSSSSSRSNTAACTPCPTRSTSVGGTIGYALLSRFSTVVWHLSPCLWLVFLCVVSFTILAIAAICVVLYGIWRSDGEAVTKASPWVVVYSFTPEDRARPQITYQFKLIVSYFQVATTMLAQDLPWPSYFLTFIKYFDFVNLDFLPWGSIECVASSFTYYGRCWAAVM
jgi:hypothetical protein